MTSVSPLRRVIRASKKARYYLGHSGRIIRAVPELVRLRADKKSYPFQMGWFDSRAQRRPIDAAGQPLPWFTYPAIHFLEDRLRPTMRVFEFGSGHSTLWFAARVADVVACEHVEEWATAIRPRLPANARLLLHTDKSDYVAAVGDQQQRFDIVLIDGHFRNRCAAACLDSLDQQGIIIWDNAEREKYRAGMERLCAAGFKKLDFIGFGPMNIYSWTTSIFYRPNNCLGI
jgi:hypothetical protein